MQFSPIPLALIYSNLLTGAAAVSASDGCHFSTNGPATSAAISTTDTTGAGYYYYRRDGGRATTTDATGAGLLLPTALQQH